MVFQTSTASTSSTAHTSSRPVSVQSPAGLAPLEAEAVDLFVGLAQVVGLPKSVGQIYGLLYISTVSLSLDEVAERLDISKGSASQGLKFLRQTGAVQVCEENGSRCDRYLAETAAEQPTDTGEHRAVRLVSPVQVGIHEPAHIGLRWGHETL